MDGPTTFNRFVNVVSICSIEMVFQTKKSGEKERKARGESEMEELRRSDLKDDDNGDDDDDDDNDKDDDEGGVLPLPLLTVMRSTLRLDSKEKK